MSTDLGFIRNVIIGNVCVAVGMACTGFNEVLTSYLALSVVQVLFCRFTLQLLLAVMWWNLKKPTSPYVIKPANHDPSDTVTNWYGDQPYVINVWFRALCYCTSVPLFWYGVLTLPLGDLNCIFYLEPLMAIYAAHMVLGERLPPWYILIPATILALGGLLLVSQPPFLYNLFGQETDSDGTSVSGVIATVASAIGWTCTILMIRTATKTHFLQLEMAACMCIVFVSAPIVMILDHYIIKSDFVGDWTRSEWDWSWSACLGLLFMSLSGFVNLAFLNVGYQLGDAALVGWMEYTQIPISYLYQTFIFGNQPNTLEIVGAIAVTIGSILPVARELYVYCKHSRSTATVGSAEGEREPLIGSTDTADPLFKTPEHGATDGVMKDLVDVSKLKYNAVDDVKE